MSGSATLSFAEGAALLERADPGIFILETETGPGDRRMLLALQNIVRCVNPGYTYVEIGSYLGGTLVPHLIDPRCGLIVSIDRRPDLQPDERGVSFDYTRASTARMLERLEGALPLPALLKLLTYDCDASELPDEARETRFDLGFIDGEHTNRAAFSDFLHLWRFAADDCVILFHDANLVADAIANVETFLRHTGVRFEGLVLPDVLFALMIGRYARLAAPLRRFAPDKEQFLQASKEALWEEIARARR